MAAVLLAQPHWTGAARALISGCLDLRDDAERIALLESVARGLGDALYPAFLRVLAEVGRHGEHAAQAAVAAALVQGLRSGRLPSGRRAAWGAMAGRAAARSLGPLEYLCASAAPGDGGAAMGAQEFAAAAQALMALVASRDDARGLYCEKLLAEADDALEGMLTRDARHAMRALALAWAGGATPAEASAACLAALPAEGRGSGLARLRLGLPPAWRSPPAA
mgnify:CR=1 FL=1